MHRRNFLLITHQLYIGLIDACEPISKLCFDNHWAKDGNLITTPGKEIKYNYGNFLISVELTVNKFSFKIGLIEYLGVGDDKFRKKK